MKICFVSAGSFEHVQPYIDFFKERDNEVYFIALSPSPDRGVHTIDAWTGDKDSYDIKTQKWKYFMSSIRARKIIKGIKPDIIHAHYATSGGVAAWFINHPNTILTVHGSDVNLGVKSFVWKRLLKIIFSRCKFINVVSGELGEKVISLTESPSKVKNINMGIDFAKFYINRFPEPGKKPLTLVCNRSFKPVYDHFTLLKAMVILKGLGIPFKLTLLGDGPLKSQLEVFVIENCLGNDVSFLGVVENQQQVTIFNNHVIYISSSVSDGTSLSLLEAMASGLFPIVSDIPANRGWINNGATGLLFPVGNSVKLAECICEIFENRSLNENIKEGQELVRKNGDRKSNMLKIENLYHQMFN